MHAYLARLAALRSRLMLLHARTSSLLERLDLALRPPHPSVIELGELHRLLSDLRDDFAVLLDPPASPRPESREDRS
jgi:hypothetical protein